jgi:peptide/nickel transport system permease protein
MGSYILRRLLWIPITVVLISIVVFLLVRFLPGNVIDVLISQLQPSAGQMTVTRADIAHSLGLDVPVYVQYGRWISNMVVHGSLGNSLMGNQPILPSIEAALPVTAELGIFSIIISIIISIPIGVYSAIRQDTIQDYLWRGLSIVLISLPAFWIGTMIVIYPAIWWNWSPPMQLIPFAKDPIGNIGMFVLPAAVLGVTMTGGTMRMTRTMMLEVLRQDYIRTAWAKGLKERVVVIRHALRNALIPVITIIGMQIPMVIGGSVIIEQLFNLPGLGRMMLTALQERDYPTISGINLFVAVLVIIINILVDVSYGWLDPRIHYQ